MPKRIVYYSIGSHSTLLVLLGTPESGCVTGALPPYPFMNSLDKKVQNGFQ